MSVHFKFKNDISHDTVTFDGVNISVADLKKSIMQQKKIGKSSDFDLQITNAQTKEVYDNEEMMIPKNTSVIVARVPVQGGTKKNWDNKPDLPLPIDEDDLGRIRYDRIAKNADLVNSNASEEDKVKAMITQSSHEYDPSKYVKSRSMTGPLPPAYTCFRCGNQGHWIKNCPTNNPDVKRSTGIPRSFMVTVDGPEHKGALLTSTGDYAVPRIDHQAYKEVKKEKPPFVPQDEPIAEPEPEIPEELLCMFCKDLLQDAVLIPCCGNSFCDECVRQVLLESEEHECPVCHETGVSPNTLIPNRFLRQAVLNYKNETGYTRAKKVVPPSPRADSPQPSPDSTVETHPPPESQSKLSVVTEKGEGTKVPSRLPTPESGTPKTEDDSEDAAPGTPLADEPALDSDHNLPIQTIAKEYYGHGDRYDYPHRFHRSHRDDYNRHREGSGEEPRPISTIGTNMRQRRGFGRLGPMNQPFSNQRSHMDDRPESYSRDCDEYHEKYDKRHDDRPRRMYDRPPRDSRYQSNTASDYRSSEHGYDSHPRREDTERRHMERYRSPPPAILIPPPVPTPLFVAPIPNMPPPPHLLPPPPVFAPQPPPPGASPLDISHITSQPPPPGVGPLLPVSDSASTLAILSEDPLKNPKKVEEKSIDDKIVEFQRKLEKREKRSRDRDDSRSRSSERHRSRSSSRSFLSSSKSRSRSRSPSRSRSRSRTPFSSRSRTRSYTPSRSRSRSKKRSYTRSRSRNRADSRSRSRSRTHSRLRRKDTGRDRHHSRQRTRSRSFSPKKYISSSSRRDIPYSGKHSYNPPHFPPAPSYPSQYAMPPTVLPMPPMRPPGFPPPHLHPIQPILTRPVEPYPYDRSKYPSYDERYPPMYDDYRSKYQRYVREQRVDHRNPRYERERREFPKYHEEVPHRIPGLVGDRESNYKPRPRQIRIEPRKMEIRELPQVQESYVRESHSKESSAETSSKRKEERVEKTKHKKHHHHHKSKDAKKSEKLSATSNEEKNPETSQSVELVSEKESAVVESDSRSHRSGEKSKKEKRKHKKHKSGEQVVKKKKVKKEKGEGVSTTDSEVPPKQKVKKKKKIKAEEVSEAATHKDGVPIETTEALDSVAPTEEVPQTTTETVKEEALDIFADDTETADVSGEVIEEELIETEDGELEKMEFETETENVEQENENESEEEELEEEANESILHAEVPEMSKWEREESDEEETIVPQRHISIVVSKEEKGPISSDIISRAESVLLSKQFKTRIDAKEVDDSKDSSDMSSPERSPVKQKEVELKSVVNSEKLKSDTLKVTISSDRDKRSVYSKREGSRHSKHGSHSRHHRPRRSYEEESTTRSVIVHSSRYEDRRERHERRYSPQREVIRPSSREYSHRSGRDDVVYREDRRHRMEDHRSYPSSYVSLQHDKVSSSHRRHERENYSGSRSHKSEAHKRSRSRSVESSQSNTHKSHKNVSPSRSNSEKTDEPPQQPRRKHSPIKAPTSDQPKSLKREYRGDLNFEPDYDGFSDIEEKSETMEKKRKASSPERKVAKIEKVSKHEPIKAPVAETSSVASSASTSAPSESESSDSDEPKSSKKSSDTDHKQRHRKSKHKKHRKHKKHKKKKSHKSKRE